MITSFTENTHSDDNLHWLKMIQHSRIQTKKL